MSADSTGKRVLILSDNDRLSRAIELNLDGGLEVEIMELASSPRQRPEPVEGQHRSPAEAGHFDLIVVAMSSPTSEPVVALAKASLAEYIGQVPLLIISDRLFRSDPEAQIIHLDFPFDIDRLQAQVRELLQQKEP